MARTDGADALKININEQIKKEESDMGMTTGPEQLGPLNRAERRKETYDKGLRTKRIAHLEEAVKVYEKNQRKLLTAMEGAAKRVEQHQEAINRLRWLLMTMLVSQGGKMTLIQDHFAALQGMTFTMIEADDQSFVLELVQEASNANDDAQEG